MSSHIRAAAAILLALALACGTAVSQDEQSDTRPEKNAAPAASGGLRAYLDPTTGRLTDHPPYSKPTLEIDNKELYQLSTSHFGLIEQKLPNGKGYAVGLKGRFRQGTTASIDEIGGPHFHRFGGEIFLSPTGPWMQEKVTQDRRQEDGS